MKYLSPSEIVEDLYSKIDSKSKNLLLQIPEAEGMIEFHHSNGRFIRNDYNLWDKNNPYTKVEDCIIEDGINVDPLFPDQVSHEILKELWKKIHNEASNTL